MSVQSLLDLNEDQVRMLLEEQLAHISASRARRSRQPDSACGFLVPDEDSTYLEVRNRVRQDVARYRENLRPHLLIRSDQ